MPDQGAVRAAMEPFCSDLSRCLTVIIQFVSDTGDVVNFYCKSNLHLHVLVGIDIVDQLEVVGELSINFFLSIPAKVVSQRYHKDISAEQLCLLSILISQSICSI